MNRKIGLFICLICFVFFLWGCGEEKQTNERSSDSSLASISINDEKLENFSSNILSYSIELETDTAKVTSIPTSNKAVVEGNNTYKISDEKILVKLVVIAEDQSTTTYQLELIYKVASPKLTSISINGSNLSNFDANLYEYDYYVSTLPTKVVIVGNVSNNLLIVEGNGEYEISTNTKTIELKVINQKEEFSIYKLNFIYQKELSTDSSLKEILIDGNKIEGFIPTKFEYNLEFNDSSKIDVIATANSNMAIVTGLGQYELMPAKTTTIVITVKAEAGNISEYFINIYVKDDNNYLSKLTIDGKSITNFNKEVTEYELTFTAEKESIIVSSNAESTKAVVEGNDSYNLVDNLEIIIRVIAENGNIRDYKIKITLLPDESAIEVNASGSKESIVLNVISPEQPFVSYKLESDNNYQVVDSELVRTLEDGYRIDIVGLKQGCYDVKIDFENYHSKLVNGIEVKADDRSGYAFFGTDTTPGAYKNDGTLKENADVIYVSNDNKNTITYNGYTGLVAILKNASKLKNPLVIRIIGNITTNQWSKKSDAPRLENNTNYTSEELKLFMENKMETTYGDNLVGLTSKLTFEGLYTYTYTSTINGVDLTKKEVNTSKDTTTYSGTDYSSLTGKKVYDDDSYNNMIDISGANELTIEGIGTDATFFQFGLTFKQSKNIEVKNITFKDYPEDACIFEGKSGEEENYYGYWIHNNTFTRGKNNWDISGERDKNYGDGAMDLKYLKNVTASYNLYNQCKKTGLVGGSDSNIQYNITFHHNFYNEVNSRLPLGRQANLHIYNNYYLNIASASVDLRAGAYAFMEGNYFDGNSVLPASRTSESTYSLAAIKSYNDYYGPNCKEKSGSYKGATIVSDRLDEIISNCIIKGVSYNTFDTDSALFYFDSVNKCSKVMYLTSPEQAKQDCINQAGVYKV